MLSITKHSIDLEWARDYQDQLAELAENETGLDTVKDVSRWLTRTIRNPRLQVETLNERAVRVYLKQDRETILPLITINVS